MDEPLASTVSFCPSRGPSAGDVFDGISPKDKCPHCTPQGICKPVSHLPTYELHLTSPCKCLFWNIKQITKVPSGCFLHARGRSPPWFLSTPRHRCSTGAVVPVSLRPCLDHFNVLFCSFVNQPNGCPMRPHTYRGNQG